MQAKKERELEAEEARQLAEKKRQEEKLAAERKAKEVAARAAAFLKAAEQGKLSELKQLKALGVDVTASFGEENHNALHRAALFSDDVLTLRWLIEEAKLPVNATTSQGRTAFLLAGKKKGRLEILKLLKAQGADVTVKDNDGKDPAQIPSTHLHILHSQGYHPQCAAVLRKRPQ